MATLATTHNEMFSFCVEAHTQHVKCAARIFHSLTADFGQVSDHLLQMEALKERQEALIRNRACGLVPDAVTSSGAKDAQTLCCLLAEITGTTYKAMHQIACLDENRARPDLEPMAGMLVALSSELGEMAVLFSQGECCELLNGIIMGILALEKQAHRMYERAIVAICEDVSLNSRLLSQWQDIYACIDQAAGQCGRLADCIGTMVSRNAANAGPQSCLRALSLDCTPTGHDRENAVGHTVTNSV